MKKFWFLLLLSACAFLFIACGSKAVNSASSLDEILSAYVGDDNTQIAVTHCFSGQPTQATLTGDAIASLKTWLSGLQLEARQFEAGNTPSDAEGGEAYSFEMAGGKYTGFHYIKSGPCYLYIEENWYEVINASDPPIAID